MEKKGHTKCWHLFVTLAELRRANEFVFTFVDEISRGGGNPGWCWETAAQLPGNLAETTKLVSCVASPFASLDQNYLMSLLRNRALVPEAGEGSCGARLPDHTVFRLSSLRETEPLLFLSTADGESGGNENNNKTKLLPTAEKIILPLLFFPL